jgi:mannose/cellobiose epimerase-like protein (N-acyl-D-glucosamine 2-epimerase family)
MPTTKPPVPATFDIDKIIRDLPTGERWLRHLHEDLLPFWVMPEALGEPLGNFPTYRNNDGTLVDPKHPGPDFQNVIPGIVWLDRDYVRSKSRQCFAYGIAFHLTGETRYLDYAKAGVAYLRSHAFQGTPEGSDGSCTYFEGGGTGPACLQRTSQDLAYALTGIGFLYYLTRDPDLLTPLINIHEHIWNTYYDPAVGLIRWVLERSPDNDLPDQKEIVAQLDQLYGYMMVVTLSLPEPHRTTWKSRLTQLARILMDQFYTPRTGMFWGAISNPSIKHWGTPHTDFGHSVKTFWLISLIGSITNDYEMFVSAEVRAAQILEWAFLEHNGSWARAFNADGTLDEDKEWWICCELDQVAGALALTDPAYARYIARTSDYWFKYMVDHRHHEIWPMVSGTTNRPVPGYPKQHSWKNALHSFEHALVSYIFAQQLHQQHVKLHFAWNEQPAIDQIYPYFYQGKVVKIRDISSEGSPRQEVQFSDVH